MPNTDDTIERVLNADFDLYRSELDRRNAKLFRFLSIFGIVVFGAGIVTRLLFRNGAFVVPFAIAFTWSTLMLLASDRITSRFGHNTRLVLYLAEAPIWIVVILLGTALDPLNPTITLYIIVILLPLFILDAPKRVLGYSFLWLSVYLVLAWITKPIDVFAKDLSYLVPYATASFASTGLLLLERIEGVRLFVESEKNARTDALTKLKNGYALTRDNKLYQGTPVVMGVVGLSDLPFFKDLFGSEVRDSILCACANELVNVFGAEHCYRLTEQELLVVMPNGSKDTFDEEVARFIEAFDDAAASKFNVRADCCVGYVYGTVGDVRDQQQMVRHAEARLSEAHHAGKSQIRGAAFDHTALDLDEYTKRLGGYLRSDYFDALTGLPNMQAFAIRARNLLATIDQNGNGIVLIYLDLENFKSYNEDFGLQQGDDLLRGIAKVLQEAFPDRLVARFGDDHFAVMCYSDEYERGLAQAINASYSLHERVGMPLKAGVYIYDDQTEDVMVAYDRARSACQSVKRRYDVYWRLYDDDLRAADEQRNYIVSHVHEAIQNNWLRVYYQPIVDTQTRNVVECEALVRWIDPTYGFMSPGTFIGELEKTHLIHLVDFWMVEHVCADYRARVDAGLAPLPVSINLSRLDFKLCNVEQELLRITTKYNIPHADLHVEVTESALAEDFTQLVAITDRLRNDGFEIWLDDFGSDYSSLTTLKDFSCDVIKLDLMFLRSFENNERSRVIIQQVVQLANQLGARSLAEGVEYQSHLDYLSKVGCTYAQGFLISKPQPLEDLVRQGLIDG